MGKGPLILVVEDDKDLLELIEMKLTEAGFAVITAESAPLARMKISNQKFDLIFLDIKLESGTGVDIVNFLKRDRKGSNARTPVILMSGNIDPDVLSEVKDRIQGAVVKPFDPSELVEKAKSLLGKQSA